MHNDLIARLEADALHKLRGLVATLYCASGCSCCRDCKTWDATSDTLAETLGVPKYDDGSGYDWYSVRDEYSAHRARSADNG